MRTVAVISQGELTWLDDGMTGLAVALSRTYCALLLSYAILSWVICGSHSTASSTVHMAQSKCEFIIIIICQISPLPANV